jgi:hypothetical protein
MSLATANAPFISANDPIRTDMNIHTSGYRAIVSMNIYIAPRNNWDEVFARYDVLFVLASVQ